MHPGVHARERPDARAVHFVDELPRLPTGKLLERVLRERYQTSG